ncbi:hypothetical protein VE03_10456 [Pseudogymnoascus sp. 23342-1-I1]|nr:hypothetical protein VE03_10456 [Pseudogymnoascus sp. 23342-1-I1]
MNLAEQFDSDVFWDPNSTLVDYLSQSAATAANLISSGNSQVKLHVDHTNIAPSGRASVRLTSNKSYTHGLFVTDIAHIPSGVCGTWPAFWLFGPDWPNSGEIDIIEGRRVHHAVGELWRVRVEAFKAALATNDLDRVKGGSLLKTISKDWRFAPEAGGRLHTKELVQGLAAADAVLGRFETLSGLSPES